MHIGLIGLGKMGGNMRTRLRAAGIEVTGYDRNPEVTDVATVDELIAALPTPRIVWAMVPAGEITDAVVTELGEKLSAGDLVIDGIQATHSEFVRVAFTHSENTNKPGPMLIRGQTSRDDAEATDFKYLLQPNLLLR